MRDRSALILRELGIGPIWRKRKIASISASGILASQNAPARYSKQNATDSNPASSDLPREQLRSQHLPTLKETPEELVKDGTIVEQKFLEVPGKNDRNKNINAQYLTQTESKSLALKPKSQYQDGEDTLRIERIGQMSWADLCSQVESCQLCDLCQERQRSVFGVGDQNADWLFIGEGPGAEEDKQGEPFVGKAGKLLDNMLSSIELARGENVYIANVVKCRPPGNRPPEPAEIESCKPYLERQIELIAPHMIVTLGRHAAQLFLGHDVKIADARGKIHFWKGIPLIVTYHPAYLLRNLLDKSKAWEDLCFMREEMKKITAKITLGNPSGI